MKITALDLIQFSSHIYCLPLSTNIGVIALDEADGTTCVYLIDSGNYKEHAQAVTESLEKSFAAPKIKAVINTHSHADHCGAATFLKEMTGCQIWASTGEAAVMETPVIEAGLIWGGMPLKELNTPYFTAPPLKADRTFLSDGEFVLEEKIRVRCESLKGHYIDQTGFLITDTDGKKVFFAGDALSGRNVIKKYWIQYLFDEELSKKTLEKIASIQADFYVPGHGECVTEVEGLVELNMLALLETEDLILDELKAPRTTEELLKAVADRNSIRLKLTQYSLIGCTLRSYLSSLCNAGKICWEIKDNTLYWTIATPAEQPSLSAPASTMESASS